MANQCSLHMITDQKDYGRKLTSSITQDDDGVYFTPNKGLFDISVKDYLTEGWVKWSMIIQDVIDLIKVNNFKYMDLRLEEAGYSIAERYEYKNGILYFQELPCDHKLWDADRDSNHFWDDIIFEVTQQCREIVYRNPTHMINYFQGTKHSNIRANWSDVMPVVKNILALNNPNITCEINEALLKVDIDYLFNTVIDNLETYIDEAVKHSWIRNKTREELERSENFATLDYVLEKDLSISGPDLVDCVEAVDPMWFEDNEDLRIKILTEGRP